MNKQSAPPPVGHNDQLTAFVERIERLAEERQTLSDDIKEVFAEAKGSGFDVKILREVIKIRKKDAAKWREEQEILDAYLHQLGLI